MSLTKETDNLNIIQALPDTPTITAEQLKAKFDEGPNALKTYLNNVLTAELDTILASLQGQINTKMDISGGTFTGNANFGGGLAVNSSGTNNGLELYGDTPFIDFHFNNNSADYTSRIIESANGKLTFHIPWGIDFRCTEGLIKINDVSITHSLVHSNANTGNYILLNWGETATGNNNYTMKLSVDNNVQGGLVLSNEANAVKTLWDTDNGVLNLKVDSTTIGTFEIQSTSDERLKTDIKEIDEDVLRAIGEVELKQFKVTRNNPKQKISFGVIAQELIESFEKYNLNVDDYKLVDTITYEDGIAYYIVNYEQFSILRQGYNELRLKELEARLNS